MLPSLIAEGLSANDRVKARLSILQAVERHARHPNSIWEPSAALPGSTWA
jgi:hypothetical protein